MGYSHKFMQQKNFDREKWSSIKKAVVEMVKKLPEHTETAGGFAAGDRLRNNIVSYDPEDELGNGAIVTDICAEQVVQSDPSDPQNEMIWFNGNPAEELDGEAFVLKKHEFGEEAGEPLVFWTKTNRNPYDLLACATLIVADHVAPGFLKIGSDGNVDDWMPALDFVREVCFPNAKLPGKIDPQGTTRVSGVSYELETAPLEVVREDAKGAPSNLYF